MIVGDLCFCYTGFSGFRVSLCGFRFLVFSHYLVI